MIRQTIYIDKYDWIVNAYFYVSEYYTEEIMDKLWELGCDATTAKKVYHNLTSNELDTGLCYSNYRKQESILVVARTSSAEEFFNSIVHEITHLQSHIAHINKLNPTGEEVAYLAGEISREMFPKVKSLMCDCCRKKGEIDYEYE